MELLHDREFKYYDKNADSVDMVNYIKTIMAKNFIEEIYSLCLKYPKQFNQALTEIEYLYSKKLNAFVYPPKDYIQYKQGQEQLREVNQWKTLHTNYTSQENRNIGQTTRGQLPRI